MRISELLERLGELQGEHGDIDVKVLVPFKRHAKVAPAENIGVLYEDKGHTIANSVLVGP